MALNIKDPEADRLARELARLTGQTITAALKEAITDKIAITRARQRTGTSADLLAIIERGRHRPMLTDLTEDEILGYDEHGIPS